METWTLKLMETAMDIVWSLTYMQGGEQRKKPGLNTLPWNAWEAG